MTSRILKTRGVGWRMLGFKHKLVRRSNSVRGKRKQWSQRPTIPGTTKPPPPNPPPTPQELKNTWFPTKIGTKTIFGMTSLKITLSTNSDEVVRQYLATDVMKWIKLYLLLDLSPMNPIDSNFYSNWKNSNLYLHKMSNIRSVIDD